MMRVELEQLHERLDRVEEGSQRRQPPSTNGQQRERGRQHKFDYDNYYANDKDEDDCASNINMGRIGHGNGGRRGRDRLNNNLGNIKVKISSFQGRNDPKSYLEWEKKIELVFNCHNYSDLKKIKLVVIEFIDYTIIW